ncbi:MAG: FAD-binding and (Fe-S)-binding domain-containing protein [Planctomycetota bacterium]
MVDARPSSSGSTASPAPGLPAEGTPATASTAAVDPPQSGSPGNPRPGSKVSGNGTLSVLERDRHARGLSSRIRGEVRFDAHYRMLYSTDASMYQVEPLGVVVPRDEDDLNAVVQYAAEHQLPLLPRGGGTSLVGQTVNRAIVVDCSRWMTQLLSVDRRARLATVEPGIVLDHLNVALDEATESELWFGADVATSRHATIGGMIGNNSAGARSVLYGRTVDNLHAVDVLLADGTPMRFGPGSAERADGPNADRARAITIQVVDVIRPLANLIREKYPKTRRRTAGYNLDLVLDGIEASSPGTLDEVNLAKLICGSEGTLAVVQRAVLNLVDRPRKKGLAVLGFRTLEEALEAVPALLETQPAAVELLDDLVMALARDNEEARRSLEFLPSLKTASDRGELDSVLYVEYFGLDDHEIDAGFDRLRTVLNSGRIAEVSAMEEHRVPKAMLAAWSLRKAGEPLLHGVPGARKPLGFVEDTAVEPARLAQFVREFQTLVAAEGTRAAFYAHASVGCLHVRPLLDLHDAGDRERMKRIADGVMELVREYKGSYSSEHGDGRARSAYIEPFYGPELMNAFRQIKTIFDPEDRLNPGNIISPQPIDTNLRIAPAGKVVRLPQIETHFNFRPEGDLDHAVSLCNGAGVCRKTDGGTMCPSYMATRDERHATRGRGNALRLAVTGQSRLGVEDENGHVVGIEGEAIVEPVFNDPDTMETLNLCLSCKGCKTECPSNVDIARYKAEYLAQSWAARGGPPLKARVFGSVDVLNRVGSKFASIANFVNRLPLARIPLNKVLGLAPERSLPKFAPSLESQLRKRIGRNAAQGDADRLYQVRETKKNEIEVLPADDDLAAAAPERGTSADRAALPTVILYADCFTRYNDPHIGLATVEALAICGYRVIVPTSVGCCGRAAISTGLLPRARQMAESAAPALLEIAERHEAEAVLVCEPSCLASLRDDWLDLKCDVPLERLQHLASISRLPEQFLDEHWPQHPNQTLIEAAMMEVDEANTGSTSGGQSIEPKIALHGHCHQKALWGNESSAGLLARLMSRPTTPDADNTEEHVRGSTEAAKLTPDPAAVAVLDTGCCGMAGSFGYTADRYEVSMAVGELALFPAVRDLPDGVEVLAPGTSCRHQIIDGTGVTPRHPIEFAAERLRMLVTKHTGHAGR